VRGEGRISERGYKRRRGCKITRRLLDAHAAGNVEVDIVAAEPNTAMRLEDREDHRQAVWVPAHDRTARSAERCPGNQRLNFHQQRASTLNAGEDRGARLPEVAFRQKQLRRIGDLAQAGAGHFEHADFISWSEPIFHRAQYAELMRAFAFKCKY